MEALSSDGFVAHQLRHGRTPSGNTSTNQRVAIAADKEERRRRKEEKKNEKMIKRALKAARSAAAAAAQKDELDSSVIDPALVDLPSNSAESSESSARKRKAASKSPLAKVSVDQFGRPTNEFARASKKKKGESSASATTTGAGGLDLDALRVQFRAPGAMEAFLSEKWLSTVQLRELEEQGLIAVKKGAFSQEEQDAVRRYMQHFQVSNKLTDTQLADLIMSKGRKDAYPRFWYDAGAALPGRPMRFVQKYVKRLYDSRARKGKWTKEEDALLMEAHAKTLGSWVKIAESVDRPEEDCRARWRDHLRTEDREQGKWTAEEEDTLLQAVREANLALGKDEFARDAPWEVVVHKMGGKRTAPQCRKKWHDKLRPTLLGEELYPASKVSKKKRRERTEGADAENAAATGGSGSGAKRDLKRSEKVTMVRALNDLQPRPTTISGIDWASLAASTLPTHPPETLAKAFKKCIKEADATTTMSLDEILAKVSAHLFPSSLDDIDPLAGSEMGVSLGEVLAPSSRFKSQEMVPSDLDQSSAAGEE